MKCRPCKGTGKVEVENGAPDNLIEEKCDECNGTGERDISITITVWDNDKEKIVADEDVPTLSYEQACEALARLVEYAEKN